MNSKPKDGGSGRQLMPRAALAIALIVLGSVPGTAQERAEPVILAPVAEEKVVDRIEALGTLRANEDVTITAQVTETITEINFDDGQRVKKGDTLALMTSDEETAQLLEAEATVREAEEQLERAKPLAKKGFSSDAILSERRRDYETAVARLKAVQSRIADRRIEAPFSGVIGLRRISVGALVEPGTVVATIDDDSVMRLDFTVPATFLSALSVGMSIEAKTEAFDNLTFNGTLSAIDSRVDAVTRSITARAVIPNEKGLLKGGMLMTVEILRNERLSVVVPEDAIVARGRDASAFIVDPESDKPTARKVAVTLGTRTRGKVEIISGLQAGQHVITDGTQRVKDGGLVSITAIDSGNEPLAKLLKQKSGDGT